MATSALKAVGKWAVPKAVLNAQNSTARMSKISTFKRVLAGHKGVYQLVYRMETYESIREPKNKEEAVLMNKNRVALS